ncbi:hypothetical protein ACFFRR_000909 [Megaselia abdita]
MQSVPKWITRNYFINILAEEIDNFKCINKFTLISACQFGEGATSDLIRVQFEVQLKDGSLKPFSLMMKSKKQLSLNSDKIVADAGNFEKENEVYDKILPVFEKLYSDKGKKKCFSPRSYKLSEKPPADYVVLEDLGPQYYEMGSSCKGLNLKRLKQTLETLAEFHAASAVYVENHGIFSEKFEKGVYDPAQKIYYVTMYQHVVDIIIGSYKKNVKEGTYFAEKMFSNLGDLMDKYFQCTKLKPDEFNVLTHGDIWTNNIMFKGENTLLLDYQLSLYGSPILDFIQLVFSSANSEIIKGHFDELLKHYHTNLSKNLKLLEYTKKIPTMTDLHLSVYKNRSWIVHILNGSLAIALMTPVKDLDLDTIMKLDDKGMSLKTMMYSNKNYVGRLSEILEWLESRGLLD